MHIERLTKQQVKDVYKACMVHDFPVDEIKPLAMILKAMDAGYYECYGYLEGETVIGYAFFVVHGGDYLLDYLGTVAEKRSRGYGSAFLSELARLLQGASSVIAEVEDPEGAESDEERGIRQRRLQFYLRNGFADTKVAASTFGVHYRLVELTQCSSLSREEMKELYRSHYRAMLPAALYRRMIRI